ncbi:MAG: endonuclease/exonuclease/phosphatase family protein [Muribaculaceae bacterium]|nr:endonuclease/exonuclease/phosphatase family protein [Muribaculaceae bacterium]
MAHRYTYNYNTRRTGKRRLRWVFEVLALLLGLLLILCAYAGKFDPQSFFPAPFLTLAYMPMLVFVALVMVVALLCRRWLAAGIILLAFVATLPVFSLYVPLNNEEDLPPMPAEKRHLLRVMTYNVLSFNYNEPLASNQPLTTMSLILEANPDVVVLQEGGAAGIEWIDIPSLAPYVGQIKARYPYLYSSPEGLNIMSKYPFTTQALSEPRHTRSILGYNREMKSYLARAYDLQLPSGKQVRLIDFRLQSYHLSFGKNQNVRVSPDLKPAPLERMRRSFALRSNDAATIRQAIDNSPQNLIVCGDMNDVPTSHVYRVIRGEDMTDSWAEVGYGYAYTFNRHHLPFRIDHILYRGALQAVQAQRLKGGSSDHYPLLVTFDIDVKTPHAENIDDENQ